MNKKNVLVLFGGASSEHEVSRVSAGSIIDNISKEKYNVLTLGITKDGGWFLFSGSTKSLPDGSWENHPANKPAFISPDSSIKGLLVSETYGYNIIPIDVVIPVLHGKNGEDGTVQGLLDLAKIPYVGCKTTSSAACMDKVIANIIFEHEGIDQAKFVWFYIHDFEKDSDKYIDFTESKLGGYPVFVKPANSGSSVGITKVSNRDEMIDAVRIASKEDSKILVEEGIMGQEVECAILGNNDPISSIVGEIVPANEFYDYEAKYLSESSNLYIPAKLSDEISDKLREIAIKAYKVMGCAGLSRVDFFVEKKTGRILLNEINTFPGFTSISMYPKLMEATGISYSDLLDKLIDLAMQ